MAKELSKVFVGKYRLKGPGALAHPARPLLEHLDGLARWSRLHRLCRSNPR